MKLLLSETISWLGINTNCIHVELYYGGCMAVYGTYGVAESLELDHEPVLFKVTHIVS